MRVCKRLLKNGSCSCLLYGIKLMGGEESAFKSENRFLVFSVELDL